jgi:hypothetical protein
VDSIAKIIFAALFIISGMRSAALAQAGDSKACSNAGANSSGQNLSDKLSQSNGVICPPTNVDPNIKAPAPDTGKMPVIPPPGSPGGNPNVQPK